MSKSASKIKNIFTPIENILQEQVCDWSQEYINFCLNLRQLRGKLDLIKYHKAHLGKQHYAVIGKYRYWVWQTNNWRVLISNIKGICFEVREDATSSEALKYWADYSSCIMKKI